MKKISLFIVLLLIVVSAFTQDRAGIEQELLQIQGLAEYKKQQADTLVAPRMDLSTEGGEAVAYVDGNDLFLLEETLFGEMGQITRSFYFTHGTLKAVIDKTSRYPARFDAENATVSYEKFLYERQRLTYWINSEGVFQSSAMGIEKNGEQLLKYAIDLRNENFPFAIPNIQLKDESGQIINSTDLLNNGKAKVFVFWSRYCAPCKLEMKGMTNIGKNWFEDFKGEVVFVSLAMYESSPYQSENVDFLSSWDGEEGVYFLHDDRRQFYDALGSQAFPSTVLFDKNGNLFRQWNYYDDGLERSVGMYFEKLYKIGF